MSKILLGILFGCDLMTSMAPELGPGNCDLLSLPTVPKFLNLRKEPSTPEAFGVFLCIEKANGLILL